MCSERWGILVGSVSLLCGRDQAYAGEVITSAVVTVFAHDAEAASAFFRDVLEFPCSLTGDGWLRFVPPTELSVHPRRDPGAAEGQHKLFLACDDIKRTVEELERKGVEFVASIADDGCGLVARFRVPGAGDVGLVQAGRSVSEAGQPAIAP